MSQRFKQGSATGLVFHVNLPVIVENDLLAAGLARTTGYKYTA